MLVDLRVRWGLFSLTFLVVLHMLLGNNKEIVILRQVSCKTVKENKRMDHRPESVTAVIKLVAGSSACQGYNVYSPFMKTQ